MVVREDRKKRKEIKMSYLSDLLGEAYKEGMTEEEISAALEGKKSSSDAEMNRLKNALTKANSEAAEWKKKVREYQTDEEAKAAAQKEEFEKIMQENADLKRAANISDKKAKLISLGYDEKAADETAVAMIDGDLEKVIANQAVFLEAQKKNAVADQMRKTARPNGNGSDGDNSNGQDYDSLIAEAQASENLAAAAYYTRLQAMEQAQMS